MLHAPLPPLPATNGTNHLQIPASDPARVSTFSIGSAAYVLPALRLGPSPAPSSSAVNVTPPDRQSSSAPVTTVSSPRQSMTSGRASRISTSTVSHQDGLVVPSSGRLLSGAGSLSGSGRDSISMISEGTVSEIPSQSNGHGDEDSREGKGDGMSRTGTMGRKGLKRLSSLMRR